MWTHEAFSAVHIELSSKCNAACPGCMRFVSNSPIVNPELVQEEVTYDMFVKWFPKEVTNKIYSWILCGNYGDPFTCKDLYKILEYICENSPGNIQVNTNAGLRSSDLYRKIGDLFNQRSEFEGAVPNRVIAFSIDGLEDTNHIYRRNVRWSRVWENLMAYVDTGASAHWDFLQFRHNVHQVEQAKKIADQYGISFVLKNPFGVTRTAMPVYNKELKLDYIIEHAVYYGYPPYEPAPADYVASMPPPVVAEGCINCMAKRNAPAPYQEKEIVEIFVNPVGQVLPCCFVGNRMSIKHMPDAVEIQSIQASMGNANNLNHFSLQEILDNKVLDVWSNSWENKSITICWQQCGKSENKKRAIEILFKDAD